MLWFVFLCIALFYIALRCFKTSSCRSLFSLPISLSSFAQSIRTYFSHLSFSHLSYSFISFFLPFISHICRVSFIPCQLGKLEHAMYSIKRSMQWDEDVFGLECDLDLYNIVATNDFNMGAM